MNEGWKCPVCGRGVAPGEKNCDHGGNARLPIPPSPWRFNEWGGVDYDPPPCPCPPGTICMNTACPRRLVITCTVADTPTMTCGAAYSHGSLPT